MIITRQEFADAVFSVNKRAKNYRDEKRAIRQLKKNNDVEYYADDEYFDEDFDEFDFWYDDDDVDKEIKEKEMYKIKIGLLQHIKPNKIHKEYQERKIRISSNDFRNKDEYWEKYEENNEKKEIIHENYYYLEECACNFDCPDKDDPEECNEYSCGLFKNCCLRKYGGKSEEGCKNCSDRVDFHNVMISVPVYYLYYKVADKSFHLPLDDRTIALCDFEKDKLENLKMISDENGTSLEIEELKEFNTVGIDEDVLMPLDRVKEISEKLNSGEYRLEE